MTCETATTLMQEALDAPLDATRAAELQAHLDDCKACRKYQAGLQRVVDTLAADRERDLRAPIELSERLGLTPPRRRRPRWLPVGIAAAALIATLGLSQWVMRPSAAPQTAQADSILAYFGDEGDSVDVVPALADITE